VFFYCNLTLRYTFIINYGMPACLAVTVHLQSSGRDNVFCIATRYGLDKPRWNPDEGEIFRARPDRPPCPHRDDRGVKQQGRGANHPSPSSAQVTSGLELYLRLPSVPA